jgi:hypothetical protein
MVLPHIQTVKTLARAILPTSYTKNQMREPVEFRRWLPPLEFRL